MAVKPVLALSSFSSSSFSFSSFLLVPVLEAEEPCMVEAAGAVAEEGHLILSLFWLFLFCCHRILLQVMSRYWPDFLLFLHFLHLVFFFWHLVFSLTIL